MRSKSNKTAQFSVRFWVAPHNVALKAALSCRQSTVNREAATTSGHPARPMCSKGLRVRARADLWGVPHRFTNKRTTAQNRVDAEVYH